MPDPFSILGKLFRKVGWNVPWLFGIEDDEAYVTVSFGIRSLYLPGKVAIDKWLANEASLEFRGHRK